MELSIGLGIFAVIFLLGFPIWASLVAAGIYWTLFLTHVSPSTMVLPLFGTVDSFILLAAPFFLVGGNIMAYCGPSTALFDFVESMIGHIRGGMAVAAIVTCMIFAAISGVAMATVVAVGTIAIPAMIKMGYPKHFGVGIITVSGTLGTLLPPSVWMIVYGSLTNQSVATLFMGGIVPGIFIGAALSLVAIILCIKGKYGVVPKSTWQIRWKAFIKAIPAILMPVLILGGIYTGIFTPTEAAAVGAVYAFFISAFIYKGLTRETFQKSMKEAVTTLSAIFIIVAAAMLFAGPLTFAKVPQAITNFVIDLNLSQAAFLLGILVLYFILGCIAETMPILVITVPLLLPTLIAMDINLVHFCVVVVVCLMIALVSPPFGVITFASSSVFKLSFQQVVRGALPFLLTLIVCVFLITYIPDITLFLPNLFGMK